MPDIGIAWDPFNATGDWARPDQTPTGSDDGTGGDMTAAVLVSLFTDRRAAADLVLRDGTQNRRGWWADAYEDEPIGSLLWTLQPSKKTRAVLLAARDYCNQALAWLVRDGHAASVVVDTFWAGQVALGIIVTVNQAAGPGAVIKTSLPIGGA